MRKYARKQQNGPHISPAGRCPRLSSHQHIVCVTTVSKRLISFLITRVCSTPTLFFREKKVWPAGQSTQNDKNDFQFNSIEIFKTVEIRPTHESMKLYDVI
jgi:hypothetical protein